jgi:hypothetical protein
MMRRVYWLIMCIRSISRIGGHVHMNVTRWSTLTGFVRFLGREGTCRVREEEEGRGLEIGWVDDGLAAARRWDVVGAREGGAEGDEARERERLKAQVERAWRQAADTLSVHRTTTLCDGSDEAGDVERPAITKFRFTGRQAQGQADVVKRRRLQCGIGVA